MITSTCDELLRNVNIDDLKWPWTLKLLVFRDFLAIFGCKRVNCDDMDRDRPSLLANRNCYKLSRVSWALSQISCTSSRRWRWRFRDPRLRRFRTESGRERQTDYKTEHLHSIIVKLCWRPVKMCNHAYANTESGPHMATEHDIIITGRPIYNQRNAVLGIMQYRITRLQCSWKVYTRL